MTWNDLAPCRRTPEENLPQIADRLARARVLEVSLRTLPARLLRHAAALAPLAEGGTLEVVIPAGHLPEAAPDQLRNALDSLAARGALTLDFTRLLTRTALPGRVPRLLAGLARLQDQYPDLALSAAVCPDARNLAAALEFAAVAAAAGLRRIKFTHPDLIGRPPCRVRPRLLTAGALTGLTAAVRRPVDPPAHPPAVPAPLADCELVIHDLFLREALGFPAAGYSGCQAGRAMAHVDARGNVYPCSALPVKLGSLPEGSLADIWASPRLTALRRRIAAPGPVCAACSRLSACGGGCRGLSRVAFGAWDKPDPACRLP